MKKGDNQILTAAVALMIIWFVSQAYAVSPSENGDTQADSVENYSAIGTVSFISTSTNIVDISNGTASDGNTGSDFSFDLNNLLNNLGKIESADYTQLSLGDVYLGDKIVVQGIEDSGAITIMRLIDFSWNNSRAATSTDTVASSTDLTASSTDNTATNSESTSPPAPTATGTDDTVSTTTSTDETASTTDNIASSTDQTASSTDEITPPSDDVASPSDDIIQPPADQAPAPANSDASTTGQ